jgi:chromosomal replication initiation ATPase DnaA
MTNCEFEFPAITESDQAPGDVADHAATGSFLAAVVSAAFGLKPDALKADGRGRADVAFARQVAMYLAHTRLGFCYVATGALFERDRTTARHACQQVEDRREDPQVDSIIDCLERAIDLWPRLAEFGGASDGRPE